MDTGKLVMIAGGAGLLYWWYTSQQTSAAQAAGTAIATGTMQPVPTTTPIAQTQTTAAPTSATVPVSTAPPTQAVTQAILNRVAALATQYGEGPMTVDGWNYYLHMAAPNATSLNGDAMFPGWPRTTTWTIEQIASALTNPNVYTPGNMPATTPTSTGTSSSTPALTRRPVPITRTPPGTIPGRGSMSGVRHWPQRPMYSHPYYNTRWGGWQA